jgi:hypothetical protein
MVIQGDVRLFLLFLEESRENVIERMRRRHGWQARLVMITAGLPAVFEA